MYQGLKAELPFVLFGIGKWIKVTKHCNSTLKPYARGSLCCLYCAMDVRGLTDSLLTRGLLSALWKHRSCKVVERRVQNCQRGLHWAERNAMVLTPRSLFSECPSSVSGQNSGQFTSPNYPNNYPDNQDCSWGITVPSGSRVIVEFSDFNTEANYDKLRIYDGPSASSSLLETLTGDLSTPRQVTSTGRSLWFNFRTDRSVSKRGFKATYTKLTGSSSW